MKKVAYLLLLILCLSLQANAVALDRHSKNITDLVVLLNDNGESVRHWWATDSSMVMSGDVSFVCSGTEYDLHGRVLRIEVKSPEHLKELMEVYD